MLFFIATFIFGALLASVSAKMQSVAAAGNVICNGKPEPFVKVELWDTDRTDFDDLLGNTTTGADGAFFVKGKESEYTTIDPEIRIFHKCGDKTAKCYKKIIMEIPDNFITVGDKPQKLFLVDSLDLSTAQSTQSSICY